MDLNELLARVKGQNFGPNDSIIVSSVAHPLDAITHAGRYIKRNMDAAAGVADPYDNPYPWLAPSLEQQAEGALNIAGMLQTGALPFAPKSAGGLWGTIAKPAKKLPETEFSKTHEIARKNAVSMLGLSENNTAMDRARAMGFDVPAEHKTE